MSGPVQLIHFADRALEVVLPSGSGAETLRRHAKEIGAAVAAIIRAARSAANDPAEDSHEQVSALLLGAEFLANTANMLHSEADCVGGVS